MLSNGRFRCFQIIIYHCLKGQQCCKREKWKGEPEVEVTSKNGKLIDIVIKGILVKHIIFNL